MGLEPTRQYWLGHLGLAFVNLRNKFCFRKIIDFTPRKQVSSTTKSKISCDSSMTVFDDSNLLICRDIKIKDTRKSNVLYTGAGNGTWTHTPILTGAPQTCLSDCGTSSASTKSKISCDSSVDFKMIVICGFADLPRYKNKGHSKNRMSFTPVREMGLEPTRQYWLGHLWLALSDWGNKFPLPRNRRFRTAEQVPLPPNQRFRAIPVWLFLMIVICWFV